MKNKKRGKKKRTMTASEMGKKGGPLRWKGVSKEDRSRILSEVSSSRWNKNKKSDSLI